MGLRQPHDRHGSGDGPARLRPARPAPGTIRAPRHVVFHSLAHAAAALAAAARAERPVLLRTAPGAARYAGPLYLRKIVDAAAAGADRPVDALIDCGDDPALAFAALRCGWTALAWRGPPAYRCEVEAAARHYRAGVVTRLPRALDLLDRADPEAAVLAWLARRQRAAASGAKV